MCVCCCSDPNRHGEWPWLLQLHYPSPGGKDTSSVKDYSVMAQTPPCFPLHRCMPLEDGQQANLTPSLHHTPRTENLRQKQERSAHFPPEPSSSASLSRSGLSRPALPLFQSAALPSPLLLSTALSPIFYPPLPPFFASRQKMWDELMQYTASPKGSWDFYCRDLIDWSLGQDSPSPLTLSLAGALCVSFFSFTCTHTHTHTQS